jgi:hypothetical protein
MRNKTKYLMAGTLTAALLAGLAFPVQSQEKQKGPIAEVMAKYHRAPKGTDPTCKKAQDGTASKEELAELVTAYTTLTKSKPPQGDEAGWKEKTAKLLAATKDLHAGKAGAADAYKAAVNCKACHSVHRPQ